MYYVLEALDTRNQREKGRNAAHDMAVIVAAWEQAMNVYCVNLSVPSSMVIDDLILPNARTGAGYSAVTFSYTAPPAAAIDLSMTLGAVSAATARLVLAERLKKTGTKATIVVGGTGSNVTLRAERLSLTSQSVFDNKRASGDATGNTFMLYGSATFDSGGC